jgi:hypothetical protein
VKRLSHSGEVGLTVPIRPGPLLVAGALLLFASTIAVMLIGAESTVGPDNLVEDIAGVLLIGSFAVAGPYLIARLPRNPIGWLLAGFGLFTSIGITSELLGTINRPGAVWASWVGRWQWAFSATMLMVLVPILFPDGRLPSSRWRWVPLLGLAGTVLAALGWALDPAPSGVTPNPVGVHGVDGFLVLAKVLGMALVAIGAIAALVSLIKRAQSAQGERRQQIKVFAQGAQLFALAVVVNFVLYGTGNDLAANIVFGFAGVTFVAAMAVAVLRYRLFDIDRLVSRTVAYTIITGLLAVIYAIGVVGLRAVLPGEGNLAVAASTLIVAALFGPLRRRVQSWVDRRFNRRRYNADRVAAAFSNRLSANIDLNSMADELQGIVSSTVEPSSVAIWLK